MNGGSNIVSKPSLSSTLLNNIFSPYGLALISYLVFLLGCAIPPSVYSHYVPEPDLMFLDPATILFFSLCVFSFCAGVWLWGWIWPSRPICQWQVNTRISPTTFVLLPIISGTALANLSSFLLLKKNPALLLALITLSGSEVKGTNGVDTAGTLTMSTMLLCGIIWWGAWRYSECDLRGWRKVIVGLALWIAVVSLIVSTTLILSRSQLMMFLAGGAIVYGLRRVVRRKMTWRFVAIACGIFGSTIVAIFFLFSFLRGTTGWDAQISLLSGYTIASYNRLAALLNGSLRYPYAGHGVYLSSFVAFNHSFNRIFPIAKWMHWPSGLEVWNSEAAGVTQAGLLGNLIWSGTFGYLYSDLGWFTPLFIFGYGLLYGVVWRWMRRDRVLGVVLYPCFSFCILFWIGVNYLLSSDCAVLLTIALVLAGYEGLLVKSRSPWPAREDPASAASMAS
jgi:hypothetical protein